jgi:adenine deaminase
LGCRPHKQSNLLIINVRIFDVVNERLIKSANVLIEGNLIRQVATKKIVSDLATVIDVGGRPLVPGLIDVHWHTSYCCVAQGIVVNW